MKQHKYWSCLFLIVAALFINTAPAMAATETLTIKGDGVEREIVYSRAELEGLKEVAEQHCYSLANNFPTNKTEYATGVPLLYLLQQAGLKDTAQLIIVTASDGYQRMFTVQELVYAPRYSFPEEGEKETVPAMVCLQSSTKDISSLEPIDLKLIIGQRSRGEQNNPWFVKYLSEIEVSCEQPAQWPEVTFNRVSGANGVTLQLLHESIDAVKIYYTTDGSTPTLESSMYNISASYYQPQLNQPLVLNQTTTVRAIAIGAGREDSRVSSLTVSFGDAMFSDLAGYEWARTAIETLATEGIISGIGGQRFEPAGNLTRGMFVTMLGRALNKDAAPTAGAEKHRFSDVADDSWYGPHVGWALEQGIVSGYPDGTFKPDNPLTIEEMIVMAVRACGMDSGGSMDAETALNIEGASDWAKPYIIWAENYNLLERGRLALETANGISITGHKQASRAEAALILYRLLQELPTLSDSQLAQTKTSFLSELQGKTPDDILALLNEDEYVTYYSGSWEGADTKNALLLDEWIEGYRQGKSGKVYLFLDEMGFSNGLNILESDGSPEYTVYHYYRNYHEDNEVAENWIECTSSVIIKRDVDYVFASDLPPVEWYANWQSMIIRHLPINKIYLDDYDVTAAISLGETTPEQAAKIAIRSFMKFGTSSKANPTGNFFPGGQYFPLDTQPPAVEEIFGAEGIELRPILAGAAQVNDHLCYIIGIVTSSADNGEGNQYVVNADGGNLVFSSSAVDGTYSLFSDEKQTEIMFEK